MDRGTLGAIATVLVALAFAAICWWAFSPRRKRRFDEAAQLPFADEESDERNGQDDAHEDTGKRAERDSADETHRRN